jgi:uncharacterized phiE125 gp8 family phage protein
MSVTTIALKSNVFLTVDDVKDWLKIPLANTDHDNRLARLLNMVTDMAEKYCDGPLKTRSFTEFKDGDASNTIVPDYYPVREVSEIRIDFNRAFGSNTVVQPSNYILRGTDDLATGFKGTDIVLRDDNNTSIVGRIFTGSVAGSIELTYTAGWGNDQSDIPGDLQQAVMMGVEYFYITRENRELNIKSKTNNNQGYSREIGLPKEVLDILDSYKDYTLGRNNLPQKNTFVL